MFENALVARVCHDLITPFNAINLGIEAFEISNDPIMLESIKSSAFKANAILKFMRELYSARNEDFCYTQASLKQCIAEFLTGYKIEFDISSEQESIPSEIGKIILYLAAICKDVMPFGGSSSVLLHNTDITCTCIGRNVKIPETDIHTDVSYKTVFQHSLLQKLSQLECKLIATQEDDKVLIKIFNVLS